MSDPEKRQNVVRRTPFPASVTSPLVPPLVSSAVFGLSVALGSFVAGILVSESELSYQAAAEVIPFRDLFAVLFFVSVGMLVDPAALVDDAALVALLVVSLVPVWVGVAGAAYAGGAVALGLAFAWTGWRFTMELDRRRARMVFFASIIYLPMLLGLLMTDNVLRSYF